MNKDKSRKSLKLNMVLLVWYNSRALIIIYYKIKRPIDFSLYNLKMAHFTVTKNRAKLSIFSTTKYINYEYLFIFVI